jgi:TonB-linked SusC/RagA family outer membrane protein
MEFSADELRSGNVSTLLSSAFAMLNAEDIDYIQVLKDGSATLYGARGAAGVILITTKKGIYRNNSKNLKISYYGDLSYRPKPSYSQVDVLNSQEQMKIYKQMSEKGWLGAFDTMRASEYGIYGRMYGLSNQQAMNDYLRQAEFRNTDWFDALFQNSLFQNHSLSISGGSKTARYYTSISAMLDPGWAVKSGVNRFTIHSKADFDLLRNLKLDLQLNASTRQQQAAGTNDSYVDMVEGKTLRKFENNPYRYAATTSRTMDKNETYRRSYAGFNILQELDNNYIDLCLSDIAFQGGLEWKVFRYLTLNAAANLRYYSANMEHSITENSNTANSYRTIIFLENSYLPIGGIYINNRYKMLQSDFRLTAYYRQQFDDKHIISVLAGAEYNMTDREQHLFNGWGYGFSGNKPTKIDLENDLDTDVQKPFVTNKMGGVFGNAAYNFGEKYTFSIDGRAEKNNYISAEVLPSYSVGASWNLHEEKFLREIYSISTTKLRATYSFAASNSPFFQWNVEQRFSDNLSMNPISIHQLTYEKQQEYNLGFDVGLFDNKLNLTADFFSRKNYDLMDIIRTTGIGGYATKYINNANIATKGIEIAFSSLNFKTKKTHWRTNFNFTFIDNKITKLEVPATLLSLVSGNAYGVENYPVGALFSFNFVGLNNEGFPSFENYLPEEIDFQRDNAETVQTLKYEGSTIPNLFGGFENEFRLGNFTLNAFLTYSFGNKIRLNPIFSATYSDVVAHSSDFRNAWLLPNDENLTNIPGIANVQQVQNNAALANVYTAYNYSTERVANGGFVRLKEVSLAYDFNKKIEKTLKIKSLRLKLMATNLCLLYSDKKLHGQDPEFVNSGGVALPVPQQFTFSLRAGF